MDVEDNSEQPLAAASSAQGEGKTIEEMYQKKTQLEHILLRPDTVRTQPRPCGLRCLLLCPSP
jgi:hypothetical protein